jgi:putative membrane protein
VSARNLRSVSRAAAVTGTLAVAVLAAAPGFAADSGSPDGVTVVNTETVQVYLNASGDVESKRVYEQLALSGHGSVDLKNPVSTSGLRNLDGFSGFKVVNGEQVAKTSVDGEKRYRSVSDYKGTLPVSVKPTYTLDGKKVAAGDIVGESGRLEVSFEIENRTSKPQEVSFPDGNGGTITKTVDVPVPMVGSLTTSTPKTFTNVDPGGANTAGDGTGGQTLSYNLVLFPPLGSTTTTVGYSADITDGVVPRVEVAMLPVDPLASPTFKVATEGYQGGASTGAQLVEGATTIDGNLLKLRDGAADLLAGLIQLRDGADQLHSGLAGDAAPGARKLADGAGELYNGLRDDAGPGARKLADGAGQLGDGLGQLADGSKKLSGGAGDLAKGMGDALAGGQALTAGLQQISGGLGQLAAQLPGASTGITQLAAGLDQLIAGFGTAADGPTTILGGLKALEVGLGDAATSNTLINGATQLKGGLQQLTGGTGLPAAKGGVDQVKGGLDDLLTSGQLDTMVGALTALKALCALNPGDPTCGPTFDAIIGGLDTAKTDLEDATDGLGQVSSGLGDAITQIDTLMIPGANQLLGGLGQLLTGVQALETGAGSAKAGAQQVRAGLDALTAGLADAIAGVLQLNTGAGAALTGSQALVGGLGQLNTGAGQLSAGASDLADGAGDAKAGGDQVAAGARKLADGLGDAVDGSGQISDGAGQLADGLGDAADGSGKIADGLRTAAGGAPQLVDGAGRLSTEGMGQLKAAGMETAANYGELYAVIAAGAKRAQTESMAFGAPAGAEGLTAYSFVIRGDDGEGDRNVERALAAAVLLGLGSGAVALRRRIV